MNLKHILLVAAGGSIGSVLRYLFSLYIKQVPIPFATLAVNIVGSFIIGLAMGCIANNHSGRLFLVTGICGGFTTFSAFSWECNSLIQQQKWSLALLYISISVIAGLVATFCGYKLVSS